ncbi:hypothetical protein [Luteolibacter soli]|uniref:Uncharacterized protein n=1 Tax=Luteolibacter soli TaxID=3135280 RepID=A0ABU9AWB8_9BACT
MKKSKIALVLGAIAIVCLCAVGPSALRGLRGLAIRPVISPLRDQQESASSVAPSPGKAPEEFCSASKAGVYSSETIKMKVTLTASGDLIFDECDPWVELGRKKYTLENVFLTFATEGGQYYVDFFDPDPEVMTLSRLLKPFPQPPKREYLQLRRTRGDAK